MLRSFNYAVTASVLGTTIDRTEDASALIPLAREWEALTAAMFLDVYFSEVHGTRSVPADADVSRRLIDFFVLEYAFREILIELDKRPAWVEIPLQGISRVLERHASSVGGYRGAR
jgi:maltose alpha-D-glucosyltransferase/alpha-amylase